MTQEPVFLYVEDDPMSRQIMRLLITRSMKYSKLTIFEDSMDFMEKLEALAEKPTVILLDIHMKPHDGITLLHMLRDHAAYHEARIVALTASVMSEEVEKLRTAGFDGGIAKPVDQNLFPKLIERILQGEHVWHVM